MPRLPKYDLVSIDDLALEEIEHIFSLADSFAEQLERGAVSTLANGLVMATVFYEPSTRTRLSFESAMHRLGGAVISSADMHASSAAKGESLADTVRVVSSYADLIVVRHPNDGAARVAAESPTRRVQAFTPSTSRGRRRSSRPTVAAPSARSTTVELVLQSDGVGHSAPCIFGILPNQPGFDGICEHVGNDIFHGTVGRYEPPIRARLPDLCDANPPSEPVAVAPLNRSTNVSEQASGRHGATTAWTSLGTTQ